MIENKSFDIFKEGEYIKIQIGTDKFALENAERVRIVRMFKKAKNFAEFFPNSLEGTCIMYDNGLIALNTSISKIKPTSEEDGNHYLLFLYSLTPKSTEYKVNTFVISEEVLDHYIEVLATN